MSPIPFRKPLEPNTIAHAENLETNLIAMALTKTWIQGGLQPRLKFLKKNKFSFAVAGKAKILRFVMAHTAGNDTLKKDQRLKLRKEL